MSELQRIEEAAASISRHVSLPPSWGVILGSGLGGFIDQVETDAVLPYCDISEFPVPGVLGHSGRLILARHAGQAMVLLQGRSHLYEGLPPSRLAFPVRVLRRLGIRRLVVTNAAGGLHADWAPGEIMLIRDHLNLTGRNPLTGPNLDQLGLRFPDMTRAYDPELLEAAQAVAQEEKIPVRTGVYAAVPGPSYETPAEIRMLQILGADAVGMSTVPEVITARHAGVAVLGISSITNLGAGLSDRELSHDEVVAQSGRSTERLYRLILGTVERLGGGPAE